MASGTVTLTGGGGIWTGYIEWSSTQDITSNTSTVTATLYTRKTNGEGTQGTTVFQGYVEVAGTRKSFTYDTEYTYAMQRCSLTTTVAHSTDGSCSCTISSAVYSPGGNTTISNYTLTASESVDLGTIIRTSSITSTTTTEIGSNCSITWTPQSSSLAYKLQFSLGSWSYTTDMISPNTTSSYTFSMQIPWDVAYQLPSSTSGTMTVVLYTYPSSSESSYTGSSSATFTVTVPSSLIPTVSSAVIELVNSNSVIDGWGVGLAGYSQIKATVSCSGTYGSTISSWYSSLSGKVSGTSDFTSGILTASGTKQYSVTCTDSRGRTSNTVSTNSFTFLSYSRPSITTFTAKRTDDNYANVTIAWTYDSVDGNNSITAKIAYKQHSSTGWVTIGVGDSDLYSGHNFDVRLTLDEATSYDFKLTVTDALGNSSSQTAFVSTKSVLMHFGANGTALGIGKVCESDANSMEVAMDTEFYNAVTFSGSVGGTALLNYVYPVGSIYMSVNSTSPATLFGGTWEQLEDRFLLGAGSAYVAGTTGGEATHTLTTSEMPNHKHSLDLDKSSAEATGYGLTESTYFTNRAIVYRSGSLAWSTTLVGGGGAHNNMPPYLAVYMWKRTA